MKITAEVLTGWDVAADCARNTVWKEPLPDGSTLSEKFIRNMCDSEHSPLRCVTFRITMMGIHTSASVHFVRHKYGVEHFVSSNRPDRNGGKTDIDRNSPVNHVMVVNAQELLFMARRRLCRMTEESTRMVMIGIVHAVSEVDPILADYMMPMCLYRGGCHEPRGCGWYDNLLNE